MTGRLPFGPTAMLRGPLPPASRKRTCVARTLGIAGPKPNYLTSPSAAKEAGVPSGVHDMDGVAVHIHEVDISSWIDGQNSGPHKNVGDVSSAVRIPAERRITSIHPTGNATA